MTPRGIVDPKHYRTIANGSLCSIEALARQSLDFLSTNSGVDRIRTRWAYASDRRPFSTAFCVAIKVPGDPAVEDMPGFSCQQIPPLVQKVSHEIAAYLGLRRGRMMMAINLYWPGTEGIDRHFDGDWMDASTSGHSLNVNLGIQAQEVAILTLWNLNKCGGTILYDCYGNIHTDRGNPGNLLIFDNVHVEHGATHIDRVSADRMGLVHRCVLSWRAIDDRCHIVRRNQTREASFEEVLACHAAARVN